MAEVEDRLTREDLARSAGTPVEFVDRLIALGIVTPAGGEAPFSGGDLRRTRFLHGLHQGGVPLDAVGAAVASGRLSFAFFDAAYWSRFAGLSGRTYREVGEDTGLPVEVLWTLRESMGYARPGLDDQLREDELDVVALLRSLAAMGVDLGALERHVRTWGESMRRIAEADGAFYRTQIEAPLLEAGLSWSDMIHATTTATDAMVPLLDPALLSVYHAQSEHTWMANVVEAVEATLDEAGLHRSVTRPPAMCFLDLAGFTRLTEEQGDEAAAEVSASLGSLVHPTSLGHGGRPVKWLGDGVMVFFTQAAGAVRFALDMLEQVSAADLPPAHIGIDAGPVIFQDGDYFGRTVNLAARIAAHARAGQVLVGEEVPRLASGLGVRFVELGPVELKGVVRPVRLHEAHRTG